jgi:type IV pilus assembly protein PilC
MAYKYIAYDFQKKLISGTLSVAEQTTAVKALERAGLRILSLREVKRPRFLKWLPPLFEVKNQDVILFSRQLAMMLERGTGFLTALKLAREQIAGRALKKVLREVITDVETGTTFSAAVEKHPRAFSVAYSKLMRVGEKTGKLEIVLKQIADYMEQDEATAKKVKTAITYPLFVVLLGMVTGVILVTVVMPPLTRIFAEFNTQLPWPTRFVLGLTRFITSYKYHLLGIGSYLFLFLVWFSRGRSGRALMEEILLKIPLLGRLYRLRTLAHLSRIISMLIGAGLPVVEAVQLARQSVQSETLRWELRQVPARLLQGQSLSQAIHNITWFPSMVNQMVVMGEETNTLDASFSMLADHYDFEFGQAMSQFMSTLEPVLVLLVGLVVGFIAISAMMPIYSIYDVMG